MKTLLFEVMLQHLAFRSIIVMVHMNVPWSYVTAPSLP